MNMSYCRFQNTVTDLADCMDALQEINYDLTKLSADEERAARRLIESCKTLADQAREAYGPTGGPTGGASAVIPQPAKAQAGRCR